MNVAPLNPVERERMILCLAEGLGPQAAQMMRDSLSDGQLRTIYEADQPQLQAPSQPTSELLEITLANVPAKDAEFLRSVVALFTDPENAGRVQALRAGHLAVQYPLHEGGLRLSLQRDIAPYPSCC